MKSRRWRHVSRSRVVSSLSAAASAASQSGPEAASVGPVAELGGEEKRILRSLTGPEGELPYPRRPLLMANGVTVEEYVIPESDRQKVLEELFIFIPVPSLDDEMYDLHENATFQVREYRVTREGNNNYLVSPYYPRSGGTVLDWVSGAEGYGLGGMFTQIRKVR